MEKSSEVYRRNTNRPKTLLSGTPDTTLTSLRGVIDLKETGSMLSLSYFLCLPDGSVSGCGTNPGLRRPVPAACRIFCSNVRGLAGNLSDLTVAASQYDILLCSETLVSDMRHVSELLVLGCIRKRWLRSISSTQI